MRSAIPRPTVTSHAATARAHASGARQSPVTSHATASPTANGHHTRRNPATPASSWWLRRPIEHEHDEDRDVAERRDPGSEGRGSRSSSIAASLVARLGAALAIVATG